MYRFSGNIVPPFISQSLDDKIIPFVNPVEDVFEYTVIVFSAPQHSVNVLPVYAVNDWHGIIVFVGVGVTVTQTSLNPLYRQILQFGS